MEAWELDVRESVRQTLADYTAATDRFDLHALAACFEASGVLEFTGGAGPLTGPADDRGGPRRRHGRAAGSGEAARRRTCGTTCRAFGSAAVTEDRVEVSSYFAVHTDVGLDHWGRYRDVLVPVDGRWLFAHRRIGVDGFAANSLMK